MHGSIENRDSNRVSQVNFTHFSIGDTVRKLVDRRSTTDKFHREREKSISLTFGRRNCRGHCRRMDLEKKEIQSIKTGVTFSYFRSTELCEPFSTVDLEKAAM